MPIAHESMIAVDTNILIYASAPSKDDQDRFLFLKAKALLEKIKAEQKNIALPVPVVAEFLSGMNADKTGSVYQTLVTEFVLLPFDDKSALVYAHIMQNRHKDGIWDTYKAKEGLPRRCLLADIAILATAEAHKVPVFYTGEQNNFIPSIAKAANLAIRVEKLQDLSFQYPLPGIK